MPRPSTFTKHKETLLSIMRSKLRGGDDSPFKQADLLKRTGINADYLSRCLNEMARDGLVINVRRGEWLLSDKLL